MSIIVGAAPGRDTHGMTDTATLSRALIAIILSALPTVPALAQTVADAPRLELEDCRIRAAEGFPGIKARCGRLLRPENPARPDGRTIELFVAVVPALSLKPQPDPLVPIAGGPGQASSEFYAAYVGAFEDVRRKRDILLLDQRGTGQSTPLHCAAGDELLPGEYSREQTVADTEACLASLAFDPAYFTTSVAVQDLEALRIALGYSALNLYGISYGSRVAQHYLRRFPEATRTVILDGVVPPQVALGPGIAIEAQNALDIIFRRCEENDSCQDRFPGLRANFAALRAELASTPVTVTLPHPRTGRLETVQFSEEEMAGALRLLSYHPTTVALIPLLLDEAVNGNFQPLAAQFVMISDNLAEAISAGMHNAVVCTEDFPFFDGEGISRDSLLATYLGPLQIDALEAICSVWPSGVLDTAFKEPVKSDVPVLLLSGEVDPITPPAFAELAAVDLGEALLITGRNQGHGQLSQGCMPKIIGDFVAAGSTRELDTDCADRLYAMPFFLGFAGPAP